MKYLFHMGHPAHFHLFRYVIQSLEERGHDVHILIKKKDVLEELLKEAGFSYTNILPLGRKDSKWGIAIGMLRQDWKLYRYCRKWKPDLLVGTSFAISHVGKLSGIPSINVNEDDAEVVPLYARMAYPWATWIIAPEGCSTGKWEHKTLRYSGYHELAYLHPDIFTPDKSVVEKYFSTGEQYFMLRFAHLGAHHDKGIRGINNRIAEKLVSLLQLHGKVIITSEKKLDPAFENLRLPISPIDMHHVMAFASLYIGDSQTMAAEAAMLGVPFIRVNDFVGKISYLNELENTYQLGTGISPGEEQKLLAKAEEYLSVNHLKKIYQERRTKMLSEKIRVKDFLVWVLDEYPGSIEKWVNGDEVTRFL